MNFSINVMLQDANIHLGQIESMILTEDEFHLKKKQSNDLILGKIVLNPEEQSHEANSPQSIYVYLKKSKNLVYSFKENELSIAGVKQVFAEEFENQLQSATSKLLCENQVLLENIKVEKEELKNKHEKDKEEWQLSFQNQLKSLQESLNSENENSLLEVQTQFEEKLKDFCDSQNNFAQKIVRESVEKLKIIKKIFSLQSVQSPILEKMKQSIAQDNSEVSEDVEIALMNAKDHFKNIHEVYIDLLIKQQTLIEKQTSEQNKYCTSIKKYTSDLKIPDCVFYQRLCYCKDLLFKFIELDKSARFHKDILGAFIDVFELEKAQISSFFSNLKLVK